MLKFKNSASDPEQGSAVPYIFGWFLGVPTSVLFLIFVLRGCH